MVWQNQTITPKVGDIVLFKNKPIYKHDLSPARITKLLRRRNEDIYGATIEYRQEVGGCVTTVNRHLHHLYPFMDIKTTVPQVVVTGLQDDKSVAPQLRAHFKLLSRTRFPVAENEIESHPSAASFSSLLILYTYILI